MESILDFADFIELNSDVKVGDFILNNGLGAVITDLSTDKKIIDNRNKDSIVIRPKQISSYLLWEIWDAFKEKCQQNNAVVSLDLFKRLRFDSKTLFSAIKQRNTIRALVFFSNSQAEREIIADSANEQEAIKNLCVSQPRLISQDDAKAILNVKNSDLLKEKVQELTNRYNDARQAVLGQLQF